MKTKKEKKRDYMRKYNQTKKGKKYNKEHVKKWRRNNPNKLHGNRKSSTKAYRDIIIDFLIKKNGFNCGICNKSLENQKIHIDHIYPVALGGKDIMENLQLAHIKCNTEQGINIRKQIYGH